MKPLNRSHAQAQSDGVTAFGRLRSDLMHHLRRTCFLVSLAIAIITSTADAADAAQADASSFIWIEGEQATSIVPESVKPTIVQGSASIVSDGKWLQLNLDPHNLPKDCVFTYGAHAAQAGDYDVWMHIGFEKIRAGFEWRVDQGEWKTVSPDDDTVDVQELWVWAPFAWLHAGTVALAAGDHAVQFRLAHSAGDAKSTQTIFALDALCFVKGPFHPDGSIKPGDTSWMTDADKAAAAQVFAIPPPTGAAQVATSLAGPWQYAGDDELEVTDRLGPVATLPPADGFNWRAITVPGSRNDLLPQQAYVHRYYLRTRVSVPAAVAGHSVVLHIPYPSMIATVFVNDQQAGWTRLPLAAYDCDITSLIRPGQVNELCVAFKDFFYGLSDPGDVKHPAYMPIDFWHYNTTNSLDMPMLGNYTSGFVWAEPSLIVGGAAYTSDVFAIPSVTNMTLGLDITVHNPTSSPVTATLTNEVQPVGGGPVEKTYAAQQVTIPAGKDQVVKLSEGWAKPKLWWTDDPRQYVVITRLSVGGKAMDERTTTFGFREWTWDGPAFKLNGIPWHGFADTDTYQVDAMRPKGQSMMRLWGALPQSYDAYLNGCDAKGMPVRRTSIFDGEGAAGFYNLGNQDLWDHYRDQLLAWVKAQRNHPSILIWSMENEITFINGHCTGQDLLTTAQMKKTADLVMALDPTRPVMVDGGNALLDESLPVYGGHYMEAPLNSLPEGAYDRAGYAHRQTWPITKEKPILLGESCYVAGTPDDDHATVAGEAAFLGKAEARPGIGRELRMYSEAYRWLGINFHFWALGQDPSYYKAWQPIAILSRHWDWSFASGDTVKREFGIFNDTRHADPITFTWTIAINGQKATSGSSVHTVAPGMNEKFDEALTMPTVDARQEGVLTLALRQDGRDVFTDTKDVSILPHAATSLRTLGMPPAGHIAVFDPEGSVKAFLAGLKIPFSDLPGLDHLPASANVLIIGKDGLDTAASTSSAFAGWASFGKVVIVLEQKNPLTFQGLPGKMMPAENAGCIGFPDDISSPLLADLAEKDFIDWGSDGILYRNAYSKPTSGGRSIIQCDMRLANSGMVEMSSGNGILILSQLTIADHLATSIVAQRLLLNMLHYADHFKLTYRDTVVVADSDPQFKKAVDAIGLKYAPAGDAMAAIARPGTIALLDASPACLRDLAAVPARITAFTAAGGWIVLNNLTPDGLADFDKLVGVAHIIRPFNPEKVTWPKIRNPLSAGISGIDLAMGNGQQIVPWQAGEWPDPNSFSYVVDLDDIAPFCTSTYYRWGNAINNFTQADGAWQLIENLAPDKAVVPMVLPRAEKLLELTWVSDVNYQGTTRIQLTVNGKDYLFDTVPDDSPQTFPIPGQPTASAATLSVVGWTRNPAKMAGEKRDVALVGIDNIYLKVARPDSYYRNVRPLLNIGSIVEYPMGTGGVLLCNIKFRDAEENPANVSKKRNLLSGILHNLKAPFSGGKTLIAGGDLTFTPIDISAQANQYRGDKGWFGDKGHTFANLPSGNQMLANVAYDIYHFSTSIVPEAIMLGGSNVPGNLPAQVTGIPVNQKADALFFLQAARIDAPRRADEIRDFKKYEMADYVIHYADGEDENVPVYSEISVANYLQPSPTAIPKAQIAWVGPYADGSGCAVAYSMQWDNPHPDVAITSIDFVYGPDRRGVPALLALTAARVPGSAQDHARTSSEGHAAPARPVMVSTAPVQEPVAAFKDDWQNVSAEFTKQIGVDEIEPAFMRHCIGLMVTPTGELVMLTANKGICVSKDQGATWSVVADNAVSGRSEGGFGFSVAYPYDGRMAFFCYDGMGGTAGGMSRDGAATWSAFAQMQRGLEFADVDWSAHGPNTIYGMTHEPYFSIMSGDDGKNWRRLDPEESGGGAESRYCVGIIDAKTLTRYNPGQDGGVIEWSDDAGSTWTQVADYRVQGRRPVHYGRNLYWTTTKGVITSADGKHWTLTGKGAEGAIDGPYFGASEREMVVVTDTYFLKTEDGGRTWRPIAKVNVPADMFHHEQASCYFGWDPVHDILYASGLGAAVYRLKL